MASVVDPESYAGILSTLKIQDGSLGLYDRYQLASKAFEHTATYDRAIADYLSGKTMDAVQACYNTGE